MAKRCRLRLLPCRSRATALLVVLLLTLLAISAAGMVAGCSEKPAAEEQVNYFPANFGDKYGYIDADGKTVIAPQFENAKLFSRSLAQVTVGDKYGFVGTASWTRRASW